MNIQAKQRIVGVVIVAAVIALLIPFLFVGKKNKDVEVLKIEPPLPQESKLASVPVVKTEVSSEHSPVMIQSELRTVPVNNAPSSAPVSVVAPTLNAAPKNVTSSTIVPETANKDLVIPSNTVVNYNPPASKPELPSVVKNEPVTDSSIPLKAASFIAAKSSGDAPAKEAAPAVIAAKSSTSSNDDLARESLNKTDSKVISASVSAIDKKEFGVSDKEKQLKQEVAKADKVKPISGTSVSKKSKVKAKEKVKNSASHDLWAVYLGNFPLAEEGTLIKRLHGHGYRAYTQKMKTPDGIFVGVYVGKLKDQNQAEQLSHEIQQVMGFSGEVVNVNF